MAVEDGVTTLYVGAHYQVSAGIVTKYYFAGTQHIAERVNGTLSFILADHLGSTGVVTDASGAVIAEMRYTPYGETRSAAGTSPTDYLYTSQRQEAGLGLYFYNARWYDPALARFAQADTIVPSTGNPQAWDRYAYGLNNPSRYTDPTGHVACVGNNFDDGPQCFTSKYLWAWGITTIGSSAYDSTLTRAAALSGEKLSNLGKQANFAIFGELKGDPQSVFRKTHGNISMDFSTSEDGCETVGSTITCGTLHRPLSTFIHEFGHVLENHLKIGHPNTPASSLDPITDSNGNPIDDNGSGNFYRTTLGFKCNTYRCLEHPPSIGYGYPGCNIGDPQMSLCAKQEQWADLYMNWIFDSTGDPNHGFTPDSYGDRRRLYMQQQFYWIFTSGGFLP